MNARNSLSSLDTISLKMYGRGRKEPPCGKGGSQHPRSHATRGRQSSESTGGPRFSFSRVGMDRRQLERLSESVLKRSFPGRSWWGTQGQRGAPCSPLRLATLSGRSLPLTFLMPQAAFLSSLLAFFSGCAFLSAVKHDILAERGKRSPALTKHYGKAGGQEQKQ
jgi:hypothetical protein